MLKWIVYPVFLCSQISAGTWDPSLQFPLDSGQIQAVTSELQRKSEIDHSMIASNNAEALALLDSYQDLYWGLFYLKADDKVRDNLGRIKQFKNQIKSKKPTQFSIEESAQLYQLARDIATVCRHEPVPRQNHSQSAWAVISSMPIVVDVSTNQNNPSWFTSSWPELVKAATLEVLVEKAESTRHEGDDAFLTRDWEKAAESYHALAISQQDLMAEADTQAKRLTGSEIHLQGVITNDFKSQVNDYQAKLQKIYMERINALKIRQEDMKMCKTLSSTDLPSRLRLLLLYESILSDPLRLDMSEVPAGIEAPQLRVEVMEKISALQLHPWVQPDTSKIPPLESTDQCEKAAEMWKVHQKEARLFLDQLHEIQGFDPAMLGQAEKFDLVTSDRRMEIEKTLSAAKQAGAIELEAIHMAEAIPAKEKQILDELRQNEEFQLKRKWEEANNRELLKNSVNTSVDYFPLPLGARYEYKGSAIMVLSSVLEVIDASEDGDKVTCNYTIKTGNSTIRNISYNILYRRGQDGVTSFQRSEPSGSILVSPILRYPLKVGSSWIETFSGQGNVVHKIAALGVSVNVPAGKFTNCIKVDIYGLDGKKAGSRWFAPGVGLVKDFIKGDLIKLSGIDRQADVSQDIVTTSISSTNSTISNQNQIRIDPLKESEATYGCGTYFYLTKPVDENSPQALAIDDKTGYYLIRINGELHILNVLKIESTKKIKNQDSVGDSFIIVCSDADIVLTLIYKINVIGEGFGYLGEMKVQMGGISKTFKIIGNTGC